MIWLVRHAATAHSRNYVASGRRHQEIDIDADGTRQASQAALAIRDYPCRRAACSSFARARTSARLIAGDSLPLSVQPALDEVDYGCFDGGPWLSYGAWLRRRGLSAIPPGGSESWAGALARALGALASIDSERIPAVVVCHGYLWGAMAQYLDEGLLPSPDRLGGPAPYATPLALPDGLAGHFRREWSEVHPAPAGLLADRR